MILKRIKSKDLKDIPEGVNVSHLDDDTVQIHILDESKAAEFSHIQDLGPVPGINTTVKIETADEKASREAREYEERRYQTARAIVEARLAAEKDALIRAEMEKLP